MTWRFSRLCDIVVDVITQVWCVFQDLEFGWRVIVGSDIGYFTVVFGSFGDDRGNGIFVPMLILIIGFDPKTWTAISICKNLCYMISCANASCFTSLCMLSLLLYSVFFVRYNNRYIRGSCVAIQYLTIPSPILI